MQLLDAIPPEEDWDKLNRLLDHVKRDIFLSKNSKGEVKKEFATFFGSLLSSLTYIWDPNKKTAATNGISMFWSPKFFLSLPHGTRLTIFMHELWHVARMDMVYRMGRSPRRWNAACDIWINNLLDDMGYSWEGIPFKFWLDHSYDGWTAEDIYDDLQKKDDEAWKEFCDKLGVDPDNFPWEDYLEPGDGTDEDGIEVEVDLTDEQMKVVKNVLQANQAAKLAGEHSPEAVLDKVNQFLKPKIAWEQELQNHFSALIEQDYDWSVRDRRYSDVYLPDLAPTEGLEDLFFGLDVSGSMDHPMVTRAVSEVKYIRERFTPQTMTLFQFDTIVQKIDIWTEEDTMNEVIIQGRGGTSLRLVADYLDQHKPRAAIIFTDLECDTMRKVDGVDIVWIVLNNPKAVVQQGRMIHIQE